jgi:hypothetical protein
MQPESAAMADGYSLHSRQQTANCKLQIANCKLQAEARAVFRGMLIAVCIIEYQASK